jgi:hypothetical protein
VTPPRRILAALAAVALIGAVAAALLAPVPLAAQAVWETVAADAWLVRDKTFFGKIHLPADAAPEECDAAETLAAWVEKVTGAVPEIGTEPPDGPPVPGLYLGATRQAAARRIAAPESLGETWHWEPLNGRALFILGNSPSATRLAVGDFIQRHLGVTFLVPGEWGAEWTPRRVVAMPRKAFTRRPAYLWRHLGLSGAYPAQAAWARNNGLGALPPFSHALHTVFDDAIAETHPEFFPLVRGERRLPSGRGGYEPQPSLAAPGAATHAAQRAAQFFAEHPESPTFSLGITDTMTWDESPATRALAPYGRYFRGKPDFSNYVFTFMNRAATALWPAPDGTDWDAARWRDGTDATTPAPTAPAEKFLACIAYYYCERAPDFPLHPNIFPVLTADRSQWRDDAFRLEDRELIQRWARSGVRHFGLYDYYYGDTYLIPRVFLKAEAESIRWGAQNGASLFYAEMTPNWGFDGPKAWLAAQLLLDATQSEARLLRHYFDEAYGPAAAPMREFFDAAERCWNAQPGPARWIKFWRMENMAALISAKDEQAMRNALDAAEAAFPETVLPDSLCDNDRVLRQQVRVRMTSLAFAATEGFLRSYRLRESLLRAEPLTAPIARWMLTELGRESATRKDFADALARWRNVACNPAGASRWEHFLTGAVSATVVERLLQTCTAKAAEAAEEDGDEWREILMETAEWASQRGLAAQVAAIMRPDAVQTLLDERFAAGSFTPPRAGSWAEDRPVTLLKPPWSTVLLDEAGQHFGFVADAIDSGDGTDGFLRMTGCGHTLFSRTVTGIAAGDSIAAKVYCRGRVNVGTYIALEMYFSDEAGESLGGTTAVVHPMDAADWCPVVCLANAPAGAVAVRVTVRCLSQEADETLDWDDFSVEKLPVP